MKNDSMLVHPKQAREILGVGPTKFYELAKLPISKSKISK